MKRINLCCYCKRNSYRRWKVPLVLQEDNAGALRDLITADCCQYLV